MDVMRPRNVIFPLMVVALLTIGYNIQQTELVDYFKGHANALGFGGHLREIEDDQGTLMTEHPIHLNEVIDNTPGIKVPAIDEEAPVAVEVEIHEVKPGNQKLQQAGSTDTGNDVENLEKKVKKLNVAFDQKANDEL